MGAIDNTADRLRSWQVSRPADPLATIQPKPLGECCPAKGEVLCVSPGTVPSTPEPASAGPSMTTIRRPGAGGSETPTSAVTTGWTRQTPAGKNDSSDPYWVINTDKLDPSVGSPGVKPSRSESMAFNLKGILEDDPASNFN